MKFENISVSSSTLLILFKAGPYSESFNTSQAGLPPGRLENKWAGLEPKKQYGKPFRREPTATKIRFRPIYRILCSAPQKSEQLFNNPKLAPKKVNRTNIKIT
jgi:hypothetical protein